MGAGVANVSIMCCSCVTNARVTADAASLNEWEQGDDESLEDVIASYGVRVPGSITSRREHASLEATELVLSNGMRLVCKQVCISSSRSLLPLH